MSKNIKRYNMDTGEKDFSKSPILEVLPDGDLTYLWIGNDSSDKRCFATICGEKTLRRLCKDILTSLGPERRK